MAEKKKIEDFGEKIEGARKDLAALRQGLVDLTTGMVEGWTDKEQEQYISKDLTWKRPDYQKMVDDGVDRRLVYYIKLVRDAIPPKPQIHTEEGRKGYVAFVQDVRDRLMGLQDFNDIAKFTNGMISDYLEKSGFRSYTAKKETYGCFQNKLLKAMQTKERDIESGIRQKEFCYSEEEHLMKNHIQGVFSPSEYGRISVQTRHLGSYGYTDIYLTGRNNHNTVMMRLQDPKTLQAPTPELTESSFEQNKFYVVGRNNQLIYSGIDTKEEAMRLALEYAKKVEELVNSSEKKKPKKSAGKEKLLPPQLEHIRREGEEHRESNLDVTGEDILECFKLRGGQFGNWTNQNDRQANMNMLYDAFRDLAIALNISYEDISLKQQTADGENKRTASLAIAWGARGHAGALAHYEPIENVINLTKMRGAGSLAHEWGHALDCFVKESLHMTASGSAEKAQKFLATHCRDKDNPFAEVIHTMRYKPQEDKYGNLVHTDFFKESAKADGSYAKTDNGYWASSCEMFARAFACYVKDKLQEKGIRSDYLAGHADYTIFPVGEERKAINEAIDRLVDNLKERGLLHHQEHDIAAEVKKAPAPAFTPVTPTTSAVQESNELKEEEWGEQMSLFDYMDSEPDTPAKEEVEAAASRSLEQDNETPAAESASKEETLDITHYVRDFSPKEVTFDFEGEPTIRIEGVLGDMSADETRGLLERAGVTNPQNLDALAGTNLTLYIDFDEDGANGVLAASYNNMVIKEFNIELTPDEKQSAEQVFEQLVGHSAEEERQSVKAFAETIYNPELEKDNKDIAE